MKPETRNPELETMSNKKYILFLIVCTFYFCVVTAQKSVVPPVQKTQKDSVDDDEEGTDSEIIIPGDFDSSLDYMLYSWAIDKKSPPNCVEKPNPIVTETQYRARLKKLPHEIEMPYNSVVESFIDIYTNKRRREIEYMLGLSKYYFPIFEEALSAAKLPLELKYLPIIESALIPTAVSRSGAAGLWQFMVATGRIYDLEINSLVDERFDPIKSTKVAVKYLKELYGIYGDWNLVLAAYNCGPGGVNKAIRRAGGQRDFWEIYPYLPHQTRGYVPIFIAANYTMNYYNEHNLCPGKTMLPALTDTVTVQQRVHFEQIAAVLNIPIEELRILNPQYKRDVIPGDIKPYSVCLPMNFANQFIDKMPEILAYKPENFNARRDETFVQPFTESNSYSSIRKSTTHTVRKGQTLGGIAKKYGVTVAEIKRWNDLGKKSKIQTGKKLKIRK